MAKYKVTIEGTAYEVEVECLDAPAAAAQPVAAAAPAAAAPAAAAPAAGSANVTAPLPGTVLDIRVTAGQAVKAGDCLLTIEAMKMENEVSAPQDGTVAQILTTKGATVNTGDVLITLG